jgi:hypothetical protein
MSDQVQHDLDMSREFVMAEHRAIIKNNAKKFIYVQFQKEGYHCFPEAATNPEFNTGDQYDVSHLAYKHMHYFFIKVWLQVSHSNRQVEFIQFRRWLEGMYSNSTLELNNRSCEMIAEDLYEVIATRYPGVEIRIDVSEDNINGALLEFVP